MMCWCQLGSMFQSTRLREARQNTRAAVHACDVVSIHAPAGGATN